MSEIIGHVPLIFCLGLVNQFSNLEHLKPISGTRISELAYFLKEYIVCPIFSNIIV